MEARKKREKILMCVLVMAQTKRLMKLRTKRALDAPEDGLKA